MDTRNFNQTGTELIIKDCRDLRMSSGGDPLVLETNIVPHGGSYLIKSRDLDIYRELHERLGWREFHFSVHARCPLKLTLIELKNEHRETFECIEFRIGPGGILTRTPLERTKCRISNRTERTLLIKNYFVYNSTTGVGDAGTLDDKLLPGKSKNLKFCPSDFAWTAGEHWEQLEFHFSIADGDRNPLKLTISDLEKENSKDVVLWTGRGGVLSCMILENTKCGIFNKTKRTAWIKNYFVNDVTTGAGVDGNFSARLLQGRSMSLKFSPSDIDWNGSREWEQMQFHFWIDNGHDHELVKLPLAEFQGIKEYVCKIGSSGGFEVIPKDGHAGTS